MADFYQPTLKDIRNRVRFLIDEPIQANFLDSDINWSINDVQQDVATEIAQVNEGYFVAPTPTVIKLKVNTQMYDLATDCWKVVRVQDQQSGLPIDPTDMNSQNDFFQNFPPLVSVYPFAGFAYFIMGGSQSGGQAGGSIGFTPIPTDATKSVQYWYVPMLQDMDNDTDVCAFPRNLVDMLAIQAAIDCKIKDEDDTTALERKYSRRLDQLKRSARDRQTQGPKYVRRVGNTQGYPGYYI